MTDNEMVVVNKGGMDIIQNVDDLLKLAATLIKSGLLPSSINKPESAAAVILKGRELGIGAMEALGSINVIQGKPTASPQLMLALARRTKELDDLKIEDDGNKCTVTVTRRGQSPVSMSFSMDDAKDMGLSAKDNWKKQPKTMRQWRAMAANLRLTFPDATSGLYTPEELGAEVEVDDEGQMKVISLPKQTEYAIEKNNPLPQKITPDIVDGEVVVPKVGHGAAEEPIVAKTLTDETLLKDATDKLGKLEGMAFKHGYKVNFANVEGGLCHKVNTEKNRLRDLSVREAGLLYQYIHVQGDLKGRLLESQKRFAEIVIKRALSNNEDWQTAWQACLPENQEVKETPVESPNTSPINPVEAV